MDVKSLMTTQIIAVRPDNTVADAARIMLANHLTGLPVQDEAGDLAGIITEGDLLRRAELGTGGKPAGWLKSLLMPSADAARYTATHGRHVAEVMTRHPITIAPDADLREVAALMADKRIRCLPVLENGRLVGIISRTDLLKTLARKLIETHTDLSDAGIGRFIETELAAAPWAPKSGIRIAVKDHVVNIEGTIFSDEERQAVIVIAENAPGVSLVQDHLIFVDPSSGLAFPVD
jgi:CBS domain-containing protein